MHTVTDASAPPQTSQPSAVCMLVYSYHPEATGGAERQCKLQTRELSRLGHPVFVLTTRSDPALPRHRHEDGHEVVRCQTFTGLIRRIARPRQTVPPNPTHTPPETPHTGTTRAPSATRRYAAATLRWLNASCFMLGATVVLFRRRHHLKVIHVHGADWLAGFAGWLGARLSIPVLCKGANLPAFPPLTGLPFPRTFDKWRRCVNYIALTQPMRDYLVANGVPSDRITIIPNGVVAPPPAPTEATKEPIVLHIANYTQPAWNKAFDILFAAWPLVVRARPDAKLVTIGNGDTSPWKRMMTESGCTNSVEFPGYQADLTPWFHRAAIFTLPSRHEGISNALLEAQSTGIPAVVSDIPGNRAVVTDTETGMLVPAGNAEDLARALIHLLGNPDVRHRMGNAARKRATAEFGIESVACRLRDLYDRLHGARPARQAEGRP